ncbi:ACT domain-containing protein [Companilactobacillus sp.]|jgi:ACT domain-containing protein|uniref:ACT domain-containing protein n=1 Tax=Companilactobacillus sp. TaxID=2767905 RepID=UPI0025C5C797|nr:ACT domain-containing protein [Companilactobacillus sp.]MCH4008920.1 ACT domain-containing protein [Companilactobacillus sp.]MCH4050901.1 ACT domain-containing protein [Companilactobacillus sp.]MCH4076863.1 ACT domain-containing protein [Companilactobacillus sp.]MCH4125438.1 ACT domain-containing protein [Companilactobacillus sp.]MCH4131980.1 ACT domain-containing protein [Companilactobacillus sp.]
MKAILTVVGRDKTGIVAAVANKLAELNVNIIDISQTLMQGNFTMMMMVSIDESTKFDTVKNSLSQLGQESNLDIRIQRQEIFDATQKL